MRWRPVIAAVAALAGATAPGASAAVPPEPAASPAVFAPGRCPLGVADSIRPRLRCGTVRVPMRYDAPDGRTIRLAVVVVRAARLRHDDPIVVLSGGPGEPLVRETAALVGPGRPLTALAAGRDLVLFDQRGVGRSRPSLSCDREIDRTAPGPATDFTRLAVRVYRRCAARLRRAGVDLDAFRTASNARDLDGLRRALGYAPRQPLRHLVRRAARPSGAAGRSRLDPQRDPRVADPGGGQLRGRRRPVVRVGAQPQPQPVRRRRRVRRLVPGPAHASRPLAPRPDPSGDRPRRAGERRARPLLLAGRRRRGAGGARCDRPRPRARVRAAPRRRAAAGHGDRRHGALGGVRGGGGLRGSRPHPPRRAPPAAPAARAGHGRHAARPPAVRDLPRLGGAARGPDHVPPRHERDPGARRHRAAGPDHAAPLRALRRGPAAQRELRRDPGRRPLAGAGRARLHAAARAALRRRPDGARAAAAPARRAR